MPALIQMRYRTISIFSRFSSSPRAARQNMRAFARRRAAAAAVREKRQALERLRKDKTAAAQPRRHVAGEVNAAAVVPRRNAARVYDILCALMSIEVCWRQQREACSRQWVSNSSSAR
jgi:hypothetical protein